MIYTSKVGLLLYFRLLFDVGSLWINRLQPSLCLKYIAEIFYAPKIIKNIVLSMDLGQNEMSLCSTWGTHSPAPLPPMSIAFVDFLSHSIVEYSTKINSLCVSNNIFCGPIVA